VERRHARLAKAALIVFVLCSLLFVIIAADRPSMFAAPSRAGFYPGWMAGPLGGLWPGLPRNGTLLRYLFTAGLIAMYGCYLIALAHLPAMRGGARWLLLTVLAVHAIFLLSPPISLTDVFNYINYGRMEVVHHLNPYTSFPILEPHSDPSYSLSNWHQLTSPYGPLFTLFTFALVPLGVPASFWTIKLVLMLTSLGLLFLVWRCALLLRVDPIRAVVLVGLNPIVIVWGLGGDHNDFLTVFAMVLGFYLLLLARERERTAALLVGAGAAFVAAAALKASAGILLPIVLVALLRTPRRLLQVLVGMILAGAIVGVASLIAFGLHIPDLGTQSRLVTPISIPNLIGLAIGAGGETETLHVILSLGLIAFVCVCCWRVWRGGWDLITACGWATVALLVALGWVLPWYVMWLLPLAALSRSRWLRRTALVLGAYLIVAWAPASGLLWSGIGFHPQKTPLGRLHQRYVKEILN
jgi:alpha-1,6-mannosyltransferase